LALNPRFSGSLILRNVAKTPFPSGTTPQGATVGQIMKFVVGAAPASDSSYNPASGVPLRSGDQAIIRLVNPATGTLAAGVTPQLTRLLTLNEVMGMAKTVIDPVTGMSTNYPGGPLEILVNNTKWGGERITGIEQDLNTNELTYTIEPIPDFTPDGKGNYLSELPNEGDTEVWEIVNLTADAHPIHLHLVQFQLMNRQNIDVRKYNAAYAAAFPGGFDFTMNMQVGAGVFVPGYGPPKAYAPGANPLSGGKYGGNPDVTPFLKGAATPPAPNEAGWKDTVIMYPGQVTRIVVRWAPTDLATNLDPAELVYPFDPNGGHGYVWHCHIIDHEDNEMMRPNAVQAKNVARSYIKGMDY
ncbi:MAG TPA: multicopper oxidase domain-containing protein, partial [Roseiflexaceae bacterium]|nr:multicopper oxidase domain-containing protein [Roseiflexaceae bacterium]